MKNALSILVLLFVVSVPVFGQQRELPFATWQENPIPHWSCKAGTVPLGDANSFRAPRCRPQIERLDPYDSNIQEMIAFEKDVTIGRKGTVTVLFDPFYVRMPGCQVTGDEKRHIKPIEVIGKEKVIITGHPHQKLHFKCTGIINRNP